METINSCLKDEGLCAREPVFAQVNILHEMFVWTIVGPELGNSKSSETQEEEECSL